MNVSTAIAQMRQTNCVYQRSAKPRLVRRRKFGRLCNICPYVIEGDKELKETVGLVLT